MSFESLNLSSKQLFCYDQLIFIYLQKMHFFSKIPINFFYELNFLRYFPIFLSKCWVNHLLEGLLPLNNNDLYETDYKPQILYFLNISIRIKDNKKNVIRIVVDDLHKYLWLVSLLTKNIWDNYSVLLFFIV